MATSTVCTCTYKYLHLKYKYEYKYFKTVLEYNSSTSTSTKYYSLHLWYLVKLGVCDTVEVTIRVISSCIQCS